MARSPALGRAGRMPAWGWWVLASFPAVLIVAGLGLLGITIAGVRGAEPVVGEVISVEETRVEPETTRGPRYRVRFRYDADWGEDLVALSRVAHRDHDFEIGERVPILIDPARPDRAWIGSAWRHYGDPVGMIAAGLVSLWLILWLRRRHIGRFGG